MMALLIRIIIPLLILAAGFGGWKWLGVPIEEPVPDRQPPQKLKTTRLELYRSSYQVILESQGTVRAHHDTTLTAQVNGTVSAIHPSFENGAFFEKDEVLLELDPADLRAAVTSAESSLAGAEAMLAQEEARAKQARLNWADMGYADAPSALVLREPQLKDARANVKSATAALEQAQRNLDRAEVRAPFAGRVRKRLVGLGQAVSGTTPLGDIFTTEMAEVRLPLAAGQLKFVELPSRDGDAPLPVILTDALSSRSSGNQSWKASIVRAEGALDEASRELFAIAQIDDPFGILSGLPELRIGQPVRATIPGVVLDDVFVMPRSALRGVNRVYLIDQDEIAIKRAEVEPIWSTAEVLVVRDGFKEGDWLATSRLSYAVDGAPVTIIEDSQAADSAPSSETSEQKGS